MLYELHFTQEMSDDDIVNTITSFIVNRRRDNQRKRLETNPFAIYVIKIVSDRDEVSESDVLHGVKPADRSLVEECKIKLELNIDGLVCGSKNRISMSTLAPILH